MKSSDRPSLSERRGATTLWRIVARALEAEIHEGKWPPSARLPSEFELASRFDVHRNTVRRALSVLRERNIIRVEQGKGAFVKERLVVHTIGATSRMSATLESIHRVGERQYAGSDRVRLDKDLARNLRLTLHHFAQKIETITVVEGTIISATSSYFPLPRFAGIEEFIRESGSFTAAWKQYGVTRYQRLETTITSAALSSADARLFGKPRGQPVTILTNINIDVDGQPIVWSRQRILPQYMELIVKFK
ncbi:GntR family transcriptional regulator [Agrobacterium tumefaciens]|uniref:GntR family transcriptional regulator n=1 Tax=Agrobacterium tumefaciens TaxID=358 RepID=UPI001574EAAA|nr:GntR family transcriptional regulator [Agrobacterium tumefaciens]NTE66140.1 GntR family transcriptional regulator [Agrobacterium tumefaciens]